MKNVLLLCYYFPPMGMGGTQRSAKFVKYLPQFGWTPHVVTVKDVRYYAHDESLLDELKHAHILRTESWDPLRLWARLSSSATEKPGSRKTMKSPPSKSWMNLLNQVIGVWLLIPDSKMLWLTFAIRASLKLIRRQKIDVVYTTSPPQSAHLAGLILSQLTGVKWLADFRDDWTGGESQASPTAFHRFINRLFEKLTLKRADRIVAMCDFLKASLRTKHGYSDQSGKFKTILNGYDRDDFSGMIHAPRNELFTITHCGSISRVSHPEPFLRAVSNLFREHPDLRRRIQIQFIGTDIFNSLEALLVRYGLEQTIPAIRYLPHRDALSQVMRSHLLLLTIFKKTNEEIITGKVFEYLASGKPILLISSQGEVAQMIQRHRRGTLLAHDDIAGIQKSILNYYQLHQAGRLPMAPPLSLQEFDREHLTGELAREFLEMTANQAHRTEKH
ncbi:MAG: glycosyltransferase [Candidatus Zhuqueibacterota bacterium]